MTPSNSRYRDTYFRSSSAEDASDGFEMVNVIAVNTRPRGRKGKGQKRLSTLQEASASDRSSVSPDPLFRDKSSSQRILDGSSDVMSEDDVTHAATTKQPRVRRGRPPKQAEKKTVSKRKEKPKEKTIVKQKPPQDLPLQNASDKRKRRIAESSSEAESDTESLYDSDEGCGLGRWTANDRETLSSTYLAVNDTDQHFEVESIIDFRIHPRKGFNCYRVKWKDFSDLYNTWEPPSMFDKRALVRDFWRSYENSTRKRPLNAAPTREKTVTDSDAARDSQDTEEEVSLPDRKRSRSARRRKIKDIRKDRAIVNGYREPGLRTKELVPPTVSSSGQSYNIRKRAKTLGAATVATTSSKDAVLSASKSKSSLIVVSNRHPSDPPAGAERRESLSLAHSGSASSPSKQAATSRRRSSVDDRPVSAPQLYRPDARDFLTTPDEVIKDRRRKDKERQREVIKEAEEEKRRRKLLKSAQPISLSISDDEYVDERASEERTISSEGRILETSQRSPTTPSWKGKHHAPGKAKTLDGKQIGIEPTDPAKRSACKKYRANPLDIVGKTGVPVPEHISSALKQAPKKGILSNSRVIDKGVGSAPRRARFSPDELTPPVSDRAGSENLREDVDMAQFDDTAGWGADMEEIHMDTTSRGHSDETPKDNSGDWGAAHLHLRDDVDASSGWDTVMETDIKIASHLRHRTSVPIRGPIYEPASTDQAISTLTAQVARTSVEYDQSGGWDVPAQQLTTEARGDTSIRDASHLGRHCLAPRSLSPLRGNADAANRQLPRVDSGVGMTSTCRSSDTLVPLMPLSENVWKKDPPSKEEWVSMHAANTSKFAAAYHLILEVNARDKQRWNPIRGSLIEFILLLGGGYKPSITDKMRDSSARETYVWLPNFSLPPDPVQRSYIVEALDLPNFHFRSYTIAGQSTSIFPVGCGKSRMLTFGALMYKLAQICSAPAEDGEDEGAALARYKSAWLGNNKEDDVYIHPWQFLAVDRLLSDNLLAEFYQEALTSSDGEAADLTISVAANGRAALQALEQVPIEMTYAPKERPLEAPNHVDHLPNVHRLSLDLDVEVYKTLWRLQRQRCKERRGFVLMLHATGLKPQELDVCSETIERHQEKDEVEKFFSD